MSSDLLRIALAQTNPTVGDIDGNVAQILRWLDDVREAGAQVVVFPEQVLTGYPAEDLLLKEHFLADTRAALEELAAEVSDVVALVGFPERADDVYNSVAVLADGAIRGIYRKVLLPNYGVFDEQRYFQSGPGPVVFELGDVTLGLAICEDLWEPGPPASEEALAGATVILSPSASPYHVGKGLAREQMFAQRARDYAATIAVCNLVGGQDELVFDGHSVVVDHRGELLARGRQFAEDLIVVDVDPAAASASRLRDSGHRPTGRGRPSVPCLARLPLPRDAVSDTAATAVTEPLGPLEEVYAALVLGLRDYVGKNGFGHVVLGLSGGIDSALVACVAVDALGAERVTVAIMPSPYSSSGTQDDARLLAANLGVETIELEIVPGMEAYDAMLADALEGTEPDITEENIQARIRGNLLMALSNKFGWLVLTTGNKSEMSVGYSTLYGDLAGGFAVIKDVRKLLVYDLVRHRNDVAGSELVPASIIERAPSAELRQDQRDEDSLPPYELLDRILEAYIEEDIGRDEMIHRGLPAEDVDRVIRLVDRAEYKRRQAPPGIKITPRAFGRDRRMPITNRYGATPVQGSTRLA